jgi:phage shock protein PspC (stress-responsive transcriptional regulator)
MVAGVCGGLADYTGIDPVIFRVVVAVATIMGGAGLVAYGIAWLVIPSAADGPSHAETLLHERHLPRIGLVGIGIIALIVAGGLRGWGWGHDSGGGGFGLILLVALGLWFWSRDQHGGMRPPVPPRPAAAPPVPPAPTVSRPLVAGDDTTVVADVTEPLPPAPPSPTRRPRERSKLFPLTMSTAVLVAGALALLGVSTATLLACCLLVVGGGLLVGSFYGRRRGLIFVGLLLTAATAVATVADVPFEGGAGDRAWHPTSLAGLQRTYSLGAGDAVLDLRDLVLDGRTRHVTARVGAGDLQVWLPADVHVVLDGHVGAGQAEIFGGDDHGVDVNRTAELTGSSGTIELDARVGLGHLEVAR